MKLVTDLQKHAKMLGREEVAKSIGPLAEQISDDDQQMSMVPPNIQNGKRRCKHVGFWQSTGHSIFFRAPPRHHHTVQGAEELHRPVDLQWEVQAPISCEGGNR